MVASASLTRTAVTDGNSRATLFKSFASSPPFISTVTIWLWGADFNVLGENTMTKLMPMLRQFTLRKLATFAVTSRPKTLTVTVSPIFRPTSFAISSTKDTSGGPA